MSRKTRDYTTRLGVDGARQYQEDFRKSGKVGQDAMNRITKSTEPASAALREVSRTSAMFRGQIAGISREIPAVSRIAAMLGTTALAGGLVAFGRSSLDIAKQFQASMKRVAAATRAGAVALQRLREKAQQVGSATSFTAMEAASAIEMLAKNGLAVEEILNGALDATINLSGGLGSQLSPAADLVTDMMEQFGLSAEKLPMIADRITGAALTSKLGFDDLRLAIGQAGGVAGKFGVDIEEFLTALSLTAAGFASGSDAGTSFKNFLTRLVPQSKDARAAMKSIGFQAFDAAGNMKSMAEISEELREGVAGLSEEARNSTLQKIFGTDAIRTALSLAEFGADGFTARRSELVDVSATEQAQVRLEGLEGALKELTSAWEALQLEAAQNGGLDLAEEAVDRFTAALRFLRENFAEVEEIVERVAQSLVTYLVGRGLSLAVATAVSTRAAYIELAASVNGVGYAARGTAGMLARLGVAGRVLTGLAGGPVGLALTAASLVALGLDLDRTTDAVDAAEVASDSAAMALDRYREAARKAADEQDRLKGRVSDATKEMLKQSRAQLQQALTDAQTALREAQQSMPYGAVWSQLQSKSADRGLDTFKLDPSDRLNDFTAGIAEALKQLDKGEITVSEFMSQFDALREIGPDFKDVAKEVYRLAELGDVLSEGFSNSAKQLISMAEGAGVFEDQLKDLIAAETDDERQQAWKRLSLAVMEAVRTGEILRSKNFETFREMISKIEEAHGKVGELGGALGNIRDELEEMSTVNPFEAVVEGAAEAAKKIESMKAAHEEYTRTRLLSDRMAWSEGLTAATQKGILDLIGYAEGTDKGRGYNETLDYGRWTGGPVNLINMTLREILELQKGMLAHPENREAYGGGKGSSAVGRYQIVSTTLKSLIDQLGLSLDSKFSKELQDRLAIELVRQNLSGGAGAMQRVWEGLQRVDHLRINQALGQQTIATQDPEVAKREQAAAETRNRMLKEQAELMDRLISTGDMQIAQTELENSLIGKSAAEAARARFIFEALAQAKAKGVDVDRELTETGDTLRHAIEKQADAVAELVVEQEKLKDAAPEAGKALEDARSMVEQSFDGLRTGASNIGDVFANMVDYVLEQLWKLALDPVFDAIGGFINDMIGSVGGGLAMGGSVAKLAGHADGGGIQKLAGGGTPSVGGRAQGRLRGAGTGRQDNILFWGSRGEFMQPASAVEYYGHDFMEAIRTLRFPKYADGGGLPPSVTPRLQGAPLTRAFNPMGSTLLLQVVVENARGNEELREMAQQGTREALESFSNSVLPSRVKEISDDPRRVGA